MTYTAVLPILGFDNIERYELQKIDDIFYRLVEAQNQTPSFLLITPAALRDDYTFEIPDEAAQKLGLSETVAPVTLNIMIVDSVPENSHINFLAPLLFNPQNGKMGQVVLDNAQYPQFGLAEPLANYLKKESEKCD